MCQSMQSPFCLLCIHANNVVSVHNVLSLPCQFSKKKKCQCLHQMSCLQKRPPQHCHPIKGREGKGSCSVVSDSLQPHGPTTLLRPWNFPGRVLERVAISFSRGSSWSRDRTWVSRTVGLPLYCLSHQGSPDELVLTLSPLFGWNKGFL